MSRKMMMEHSLKRPKHVTSSSLVVAGNTVVASVSAKRLNVNALEFVHVKEPVKAESL